MDSRINELTLHYDYSRTYQAQKKQATILFCDIVNYTKRTLTLPTELLAEEMQSFQQNIYRIAERHNGHIVSFSGDGCMLVFGHPKATEHDAANAIQCALDIKKNFKQPTSTKELEPFFPLEFRISIDTSMLCFTQPQNPSAPLGQHMFGRAAILATRLQEAASPWQIIVSHNTYRLTQHDFKFEKLTSNNFKGFTQPILAWRVLGAQPLVSPSVYAHTHFLSKFIGRQNELNLLNEKFNLSKAGRSQTILISAEAGIGKSRLLHAFYQKLSNNSVYRIMLHCPKQQQPTQFFPIINEISRWYQLRPDDSIMRKQVLLIQALSTLGINDDQNLELFFDLMSVPIPRHVRTFHPNQQKKRYQTINLLCKIVYRMSQLRPVVVMVDNLHNADHATRQWLQTLSQSNKTGKVLLIACSRNKHDIRHFANNSTHIILPPFSQQESQQIVQHLLHHRKFKNIKHQDIINTCNGVPLYLEEVSWSILWHLRQGDLSLFENIKELPMSDKLLVLFNNQIGQVKDAGKTAQLACIHRNGFELSMLQMQTHKSIAKIQKHIQQLMRQDIIIKHNGSYQFKHKLMQLAIYKSLTATKRKQYHAHLAEILHHQTSMTQPKLIAWHYLQATDYFHAALFYLEAAKSAMKQQQLDQAYQSSLDGLNALRVTAECYPHKETLLELELTHILLFSAWYLGIRKSNHINIIERCSRMATNLNRADIERQVRQLRTLLKISTGQKASIHSAIAAIKHSLDKEPDNTHHLQLLCLAKFFSGQHQQAHLFLQKLPQPKLNTSNDLVWQPSITHLVKMVEILNYQLMSDSKTALEELHKLQLSRNNTPYFQLETQILLCVYRQLNNQLQDLQSLSESSLKLAQKHKFKGLATMAQIFKLYTKNKTKPKPRNVAILEKLIGRSQKFYGFILSGYFTCLLSQAKLDTGLPSEADISACDAINIANITGEKWILPWAYEIRKNIKSQNNRYHI